MKWSGDVVMHSAFVSVCRLCMAEGTECMKPIFTESEHDGEKFMLSTRINAVTSLKIRQGDQLPEQACQDCIAQVNRWYEFKTLCDSSDKLLRLRLKQLEGDPDMVMFQLKEELPEEAAAAVCPLPRPTANPLLLPPADGENISYSLVQADSGLGRISNAFSLRQDADGVAHGIIFNGDTSTSSLQQGDSLRNGVSSPFRFLCTLCDARFARKAQLKRHIAAHCGEPPHTCSRCDAGFSQKTDLAKHMRVHFNLPSPRSVQRPAVRSYTCSQCHWGFRQPLALLHHQTMHTGPSRQQCVFCRRVCTSASQLHFHLTLEHGRNRRRRQCRRCNQSFYSLTAVLRHRCTDWSVSAAKRTIISATNVGAKSSRSINATSSANISATKPAIVGVINSTIGATDRTPVNVTGNSTDPCNSPSSKYVDGANTSMEQSTTQETSSLSPIKYDNICDSRNNIKNNPEINTVTHAGNFSEISVDHSSDHSSYISHSINERFEHRSSDVSSDIRTDDPHSNHPVDNIADDQFASSSNDSGASHSNDFSTDQSNDHSTEHANEHFTYVTENISEDLSEHCTEERLGPIHVPASEQLPVLSEES